MKNNIFNSMHPNERRQFLRQASTLLALPLFDASFRASFWDQIGIAHGADTTAEPRYFLEVNFRDQWDFGGAFLAPGVAAAVGQSSNIAVFGTPVKATNDFFLTPEAAEIAPHLDSVAMMEIGENCIGTIHHHEAGNAMRSPGRSYNEGAGKKDMASTDKRPGGRSGGNEVLFSSSPTPAILHNAACRAANPNLRKGMIIRSSVRADTHTFYHFEGNLADAQPDRFFDRKTLLQSFTQPLMQSQNSILTAQSPAILNLIKRLDRRYFTEIERQTDQAVHENRLAKVNFAANMSTFNLKMTPEEMAQWSDSIPGQFSCPDNSAESCVVDSAASFNLGEMFGYAAKLFISDTVRSLAIDFDFHDVHTARSPLMLKTQGMQTAKPLARLIKALKDAGIYDRTVIAMYTLDGSRSPTRESTGYFSKNAFILAGGGIKGGYFGDIRNSGGGWTYHRPDDNGKPIANGISDGNENEAENKSKRVSGQDIYKTIATASGVPAKMIESLPDVKNGKILSYLMKP